MSGGKKMNISKLKLLTFLIISIFSVTGAAQGIINNDMLLENQDIIEPNNIVDIGYYIERQDNITLLPLLIHIF